MAEFPNPSRFITEAFTELKKSSWLPRQQAVGSTVVVLAVVGVVAVYVASVDYVLTVVMGALLGR